MTVVHRLDTPITRATIADMSMDELEKHIEGVRERRMRQYTVWQEGMLAKQVAKDAKDAATLGKLCDQLMKELESIDKKLEKASGLCNKIRAAKMVSEL